MKKWFKIENKADKAEIWIYEQIGEDFWSGGGTTAKSFQKEFAGIKASQIDLHINSPGGEVFDGLTIYNLIKQHPANVTTYIDGLAGSIASVIALAGDKVIMAENALYMIHQPWGRAIGNAEELRKMAATLDKVSDSIRMAYIDKSGKDMQEINDMMSAETWFSAQEAKEYGFVDEITEEMDMAACARFAPIMAKYGFKKIPKSIANKPENERDLESILRDAGYTRKEAKSIIACGFKGVLRDVGQPEKAQLADPLRDAGQTQTVKRDRVSELLTRAELIAPTTA